MMCCDRCLFVMCLVFETGFESLLQVRWKFVAESDWRVIAEAEFSSAVEEVGVRDEQESFSRKVMSSFLSRQRTGS